MKKGMAATLFVLMGLFTVVAAQPAAAGETKVHKLAIHVDQNDPKGNEPGAEQRPERVEIL